MGRTQESFLISHLMFCLYNQALVLEELLKKGAMLSFFWGNLPSKVTVGSQLSVYLYLLHLIYVQKSSFVSNTAFKILIHSTIFS
jgi:hypothetical protein